MVNALEKLQIPGLKLFFILTIAAVLFVFAPVLSAQIPVPRPIAETEIRDGSSIRMRSIELERVKQNAAKVDSGAPSVEQEIKLKFIKEDFESIQSLQNSIVNIYKTSNPLGIKKIAEAAAEIKRRSIRLDSNLFTAKPGDDLPRSKINPEKVKKLRELIILLDRAVGNFVSSPIFENGKLVDAEISKSAKEDLADLIELSTLLANKEFK